MSRRLLTLVLLVVLLAPNIGLAAERFDIKVLYAGNLGSSRAKDYTTLLDKHFISVTAVSYEEFQSSQAEGHDVVIFDWTTIYPRDEAGKIDNEQSITMPKPPQFADDFTKPTILVGAGGGMICNRLSMAIDWW